ncbi:hypothetical protein EVAR_76156_1 [Eumeta japonica]|uniref:Sushi domain-containing protein n=1 Tax=Eumeta variegata TaxID=151549 RepID=A0A4C1UVU4_EUMVA|nr:hypothetical protein EVAR_76156_1 [Eumeta japonica]
MWKDAVIIGISRSDWRTIVRQEFCSSQRFTKNCSIQDMKEFKYKKGWLYGCILCVSKQLIQYFGDMVSVRQVPIVLRAKRSLSRQLVAATARRTCVCTEAVTSAHHELRFSPFTEKMCVLPQYPENGSYIVINDTKAGPGDAFDDISLILCTSDEYFALEVVYLACARGAWSREILKRVQRPIVPWNSMTNQEASPTTNSSANPEYCKLPPYPEHGLYVVAGDARAAPGAERASASLEYACRGGYGLVGAARVRCEGGTWRGAAPQCLNTTETPGSTAKTPSP